MDKDIYRNFENTNVLVVGGAGFVGSNLVKMLLSQVVCIEITIVDNLLSSEITNVPVDERIKFIENSITDFRALSQITDKYDYIFHLATFHGNQSSIIDPVKDHENNVMTTLMLFERIKYFQRLKKVVYSSAGCSVAKKTFGTATATLEDGPVDINQDSPYSISKIIGEFYSRYYFKQHNLPVVRARFQNVYGPGEILGAGQWRGTYASVWRNVIPTFIYKALHSMKLPLENEGAASRDFIFVEDICRGLLYCAARGDAGDVYNIASGVETMIADLADIINKYAENNAGVEILPKRNWDNSGKRFASINKAEAKLGFKAEVILNDGIKQTIEWTRLNMTIIEQNISKHEEHMKRL